MATAQDVLNDWSGEDGERYIVANKEKGLVLRWLNEAQLRFSDVSEVLRDIWQPSIDSDGVIDLPDDFLKEIPHKILWTTNVSLSKIDYPRAILNTFSDTSFYSIWGGRFYVWTPAVGNPTIPYIKKPDIILSSTLASGDLDIPTEYHIHLVEFMEAKYQQRLGNFAGYSALLQRFQLNAQNAGVIYSLRNDPVPFMMGGQF